MANVYELNDDIVAEVKRAVEKFPTWPVDPIHAAGVVAEESGELMKSALQMCYEPHKTSLPDLREEAVQTAAMALRFLVSLDNGDYHFVAGLQTAQELDGIQRAECEACGMACKDCGQMAPESAGVGPGKFSEVVRTFGSGSVDYKEVERVAAVTRQLLENQGFVIRFVELMTDAAHFYIRLRLTWEKPNGDARTGEEFEAAGEIAVRDARLQLDLH